MNETSKGLYLILTDSVCCCLFMDRLTIDNLATENKQLHGNIKQLKGKVEKNDKDIQQQFAEFIEVCQ